MPPSDWHRIFETSADPARAAHHFSLLRDACGAEALDRLPTESRPALTAVMAGSKALSESLIRHSEWLDLFADFEALQNPRRKSALVRERDRALADLDTATSSGAAAAFDQLHEQRLRELLRIGTRDLARLGTLPDIVLELSNAADVFMDGVLRVVWKQQVERSGTPWHQDPDGTWQPTDFCVLGMGKLGGQELNYSSDVDLLFVYTEEGSTFRTPPKRKTATGQVLANHAFFKRLCETFIKEASGRGVDGGGLRIDMRLRPEGDSGPLARSLDSYENFYAAWGQTWERMMLLKARGVAGDETLAGEFLERVQPFRYPRSLGEGIFREMAEMKARIEKEIVRAGELDRNVKLGRGGIREIEFIVQSLQVLHGGKNPFLQTPHTLTGLPKLVAYQLLPEADASVLAAAYPFLRDIEHRIQMEEQRQTHTLPADAPALERIARLMGYSGTQPFQAALADQMNRVRSLYEGIFGTVGSAEAPPEENPLPGGFTEDAPAWKALLERHQVRDPEKGVRLLRVLVEGPGFVHVSPRTRELGRRLISRVLELCPQSGPQPSSKTPSARRKKNSPTASEEKRFVLSDPDRVLARLDSYIAAYGARSSLYELWTARPIVLDHLLKLFDRSEFLAELAIRVPDLVDELESGGHLRRQKTAAQTLADLRHGLGDKDQHLWLRRYFQTEFMRLGLRDILGFVQFEDANRELTALAEACLEYALQVVTRKNGLRVPPFAVIALGKFGGAELVYGSDLDILFVAPDKTLDLPRLQKIAGQMVELLTTRTEHGAVFELDTRLRPDGEKGLLVNVLKSYEDYYRQRAMLWEIQALTRARLVAGHTPTGTSFIDLAQRLTHFREPSLPLTAYRPDWKSEIAHMRQRIELERTPVGKDLLAFKTGCGGLVDAEFLAQTLAMEGGWFEPNTLASLRRARDTGSLPTDDADLLIENFRRLRHMESILRRWSFEGEAVLPDDPAPQYRVAVRCGYSETAAFFADLAQWRAAIRRVYAKRNDSDKIHEVHAKTLRRQEMRRTR